MYVYVYTHTHTHTHTPAACNSKNMISLQVYQNENSISFLCTKWVAYSKCYKFLMHYGSELFFKMERMQQDVWIKEKKKSESLCIFQVFLRAKGMIIKATWLRTPKRNVTCFNMSINTHHSRNSINGSKTNVG